MRAIFVFLMLLAGPAHANKAEAEQLFRIGAEAFRAKDYAAAASNFDRAYELFAAPEIAFSAAQAHRLQYANDADPKRVKRALALYEAYIEKAPTGPKIRDARAHLGAMRDLFVKLEASGRVIVDVVKDTPTIFVAVALENALVTVDGKSVDRHKAIEVDPGAHLVAVSADGYAPVERKVVVDKGQAIVPIELEPQPAALSIKTQPDAMLVVDGRPIAMAPTVALAPGKRLVTVYARGREPVQRELDLRPGQAMALDVPLQATTRRRMVKWVWAGTAAAGAATILFAAIAIDANSSASDLRDSTTALDGPQSARYDRLRDRRDRARTTSLLFGGATLLAAGAALWLYYADTPSPDELARPVERPRDSGGFAPVALVGGAGITYSGGF